MPADGRWDLIRPWGFRGITCISELEQPIFPSIGYRRSRQIFSGAEESEHFLKYFGCLPLVLWTDYQGREKLGFQNAAKIK